MNETRSRTRLAGYLATAAIAAVGLGACGSSSKTSSGNSGGSSSSASSGPSTGGATSAGASTTASTGAHTNIVYLENGPTTYTAAADAALKKLAKADNFSVTIDESAFNPQTQEQQCQDAISSGKYKAMLIYPVNNATAIPCVKQAAAAGIKVVATEGQVGPKYYVNGPPQIPGELAWDSYDVTYGAQAASNLTAQACAQLKANPCQIAFFSGPTSDALPGLEFTNLQADVAKHSGIHIVAHYEPGYDAPNAAITSTQDLLQKDPKINVIVEDDDGSAAGVVEALQRAGKTHKVLLVGQGANVAAMQRIKSGTEFGTIATFPASDAEWAAGTLLKAVRGEKITQNAMPMQDLSPLGKGNVVITKANASKFQPQWG